MCPRLRLPWWLAILLPVGAGAGGISAGLASCVGAPGPGDQPSGQRETHAWPLTPRTRRQPLGNQEVIFLWATGQMAKPQVLGPKPHVQVHRCVRMAHMWSESLKLFPPWKPPPLARCSCLLMAQGPEWGLGVGAD